MHFKCLILEVFKCPRLKCGLTYMYIYGNLDFYSMQWTPGPLSPEFSISNLFSKSDAEHLRVIM